MSKNILVEISPGELIDKITILEIKAQEIKNQDQLNNVKLELNVLTETRDSYIVVDHEISRLTAALRTVNQALWKIEDDIRDCERNNDFGDQFIELARSVYKTNDERAKLKRDINIVLGSRIIEEKSYNEY